MEAKMMMAYFLLLLRSVAVPGDAGSLSQRARSPCEFLADIYLFTDEEITRFCLVHPEIVEIANRLKGSDEYRRNETIAQCELFTQEMFTGRKPDYEKIEKRLGSLDVFKEGPASCDRSLLTSYQAYEYTQCLLKYCDEAWTSKTSQQRA